MSNEEKIEKFVREYDIEVPEQMVTAEYEVLIQNMRHQMRYDTMLTGREFWGMKDEVGKVMDDLKTVAYFSVKTDLVMNDVLAKHEFHVTSEELEAEANALANRQETTIEVIKQFFGDDLKMLETDIKKRKAEEWICARVDE